jgi:hypothetical protein
LGKHIEDDGYEKSNHQLNQEHNLHEHASDHSFPKNTHAQVGKRKSENAQNATRTIRLHLV